MVCFKKLNLPKLILNCPLYENCLVYLFPLPFVHNFPSFNLVDEVIDWYLRLSMNNHPYLLYFFDDLHIFTEVVPITILIVARPKKCFNHSYDILGVGMLWKPKEARILTNFIDQPMNIW